MKIGQASISEKGTIDGKKGDQTKKEVYIRDWYSYPWNTYLECTDTKLADKAASYMEQICKCENFGYSQYTRWTFLTAIQQAGSVSKAVPSNCDCSSLAVGCYILAGLQVKGYTSAYTGNMKQLLLNTGKFKAYTDDAHIDGYNNAMRGGIYVNTVHHTMMTLENGYNKIPTKKLNTVTKLVTKKAAIAGNQVNVRQSPTTSSKALTQLYKSKGHKVYVIGQYGNWYKVQFTLQGKKYVGWIYKQYVKV